MDLQSDALPPELYHLSYLTTYIHTYIHIEIHDQEEAENTHAQVTRGNTRKNQKTGLSYCRPSRDYKKCVKWSGAMNKEIYLMYMRAKPTEKTGIKTEKILTVTKEIQKLALLGTLKVCKNFQKIV